MGGVEILYRIFYICMKKYFVKTRIKKVKFWILFLVFDTDNVGLSSKYL